MGANAAGADTFDFFDNNGADWPNKWPDCGKSNQSPIDLRTDWEVVKAKEDSFYKMYTNQETANINTPIKIEWTANKGDTLKIPVDKKDNATQTFSSKYAKTHFGATDRFNGV